MAEFREMSQWLLREIISCIESHPKSQKVITHESYLNNAHTLFVFAVYPIDRKSFEEWGKETKL